MEWRKCIHFALTSPNLKLASCMNACSYVYTYVCAYTYMWVLAMSSYSVVVYSQHYNVHI